MWRVPLAAFVTAALALASFGCDGNGNSEGPGGSTSSGAGLSGNGVGGGGHGGVGGTGGELGTGGAAQPVYVGVTANPLASPATASDVLLAELTTFAAGVRVVAVAPRYDQLDANDLSALQARLDSYAARDLRIVVTIAVVDELADHRPSAQAALAWNDPSAVTAMTTLVDALLGSAAGQLDGLMIGRDSDVYLEANPAETAGFVDFATQVFAHLEVAAPGLAHGVGVRYQGASPPTVHTQLLALGDTAVLSYLPGAGAATLPTDISVAKDLDAMIAEAAARPVMLQRVGISSATSLGSSPQTQQNVIEALFSALAPRREYFPLVNLHQLHDLIPDACDAYAAEQGLTPADPQVVYTCSMGVRDVSGEPKPAWYGVLEAMAVFATP